MKYYAVKNGLVPGIYTSWDECRKQITGFSNAVYKSFSRKEDAEKFLNNSREERYSDDSPIAYVDGSYDAGSGTYSYGAVIIYDGKEVWLSNSYSNDKLAEMNNVAGELMGSMCSMNYALRNGISKLLIVYDYAGVKNWCTGDWRCKTSGTSLYKRYYDEISKILHIHFRKVKGHSGHYYNNLADSLARDALGLANESNKRLLNDASKSRRVERRVFGL